MHYLRSIKYIFEHKEWVTNVLMVLVCALIPIIGQLLLLGYMFELIEFWRANPGVKDYPKFDFNRFTPYLKRGVWPFLVNLVLGTVLSLPLSCCAIGIQFTSMAVAREEPVLMIPLFLLFFAVIFGGTIFAAALVWPGIVHAGLKQGIDIPSMIAFIKDFLKRVGKETVLAMAFMVAVATVMSLVGVCAFFVGAMVAGAIATMMYHHLSYQLYDLYLQRGGTEVVAAETTTPAAEPRYAEPMPPPPSPPDDRIRPA